MNVINEQKSETTSPEAHGSAQCQEIQKLEAQATRYENAVSSTAGPSSQEYISPQRFDHYMKLARECREKAERLKAPNDKVSGQSGRGKASDSKRGSMRPL